MFDPHWLDVNSQTDLVLWGMGAIVVAFYGSCAVLVVVKRRNKNASASRASVMGELELSPRKACEGIALVGQTGSGKSSILKRLMTELLSTGCACLWVTVKTDEPLVAAKVVYNAGRTAKLFIPGESKCNLLRYELEREGGSPESVAQFLEYADEVMNGGREGKEESFWSSARRQTASLAISAVWIAFGRNATWARVYEFLTAIPSAPDQIRSDNAAYMKGACHQTLLMASETAETAEEKRRVDEAIDYFTRLLPAAGEKVYGANVMHLSALLAPFMRGKLFETVNCGDSDILPDDPCKGECVILANPIVENRGNQLIQILFSQMTIEAAIRRKVTPETPVVVVVRDELQLCSNPRFDAQAQTIARSQKLACVSAFQSLSVLYEAMQDGMRAKHRAMSVLGNLNTKVFLANTDTATMEYFSELSGKHFKMLTGGSQVQQQQQLQQLDMLGVGDGYHMNFHQTLTPRKLGSALSNLKTGGEEHGFVVTGYLHQSGRRWNGSPFKTITVEQQL
jgi:hypothetical protein